VLSAQCAQPESTRRRRAQGRPPTSASPAPTARTPTLLGHPRAKRAPRLHTRCQEQLHASHAQRERGSCTQSRLGADGMLRTGTLQTRSSGTQAETSATLYRLQVPFNQTWQLEMEQPWRRGTYLAALGLPSRCQQAVCRQPSRCAR
jgi:hypothetical protein